MRGWNWPRFDWLRQRRHRWRTAGIAAATVALVLVFGVWLQARGTPAYWTENEEVIAAMDDAGQLDLVAARFEQHVMGTFNSTAIPDPDDWSTPVVVDDGPVVRTLFVAYEEVNAWLRERLPRWAAHRSVPLPPQLDSVMLTGKDGQLIAAASIQGGGGPWVLSADLDVTVDDRGLAKLHASSTHIGHLRTPITVLQKRLQEQLGQQVGGEVAAALSGQSVEPVFRHPGYSSKRVRLTSIDIGDKGVTLTFRDEDRPRRRRNRQ